MGCDIHAWIVKDNKVLQAVEINRSYTSFGVLAGVRRPVENPIAADREWPDEIYDLLESELGWQASQLHSRSWVTLAEIQKYFKVHPELVDECGIIFTEIIPPLESAGQGAVLYFGFDN